MYGRIGDFSLYSGHLHEGGVESRPVPLPRSRPNPTTTQSSRTAPDAQDDRTWATTVFNPSGDRSSSGDADKCVYNSFLGSMHFKVFNSLGLGVSID